MLLLFFEVGLVRLAIQRRAIHAVAAVSWGVSRIISAMSHVVAVAALFLVSHCLLGLLLVTLYVEVRFCFCALIRWCSSRVL